MVGFAEYIFKEYDLSRFTTLERISLFIDVANVKADNAIFLSNGVEYVELYLREIYPKYMASFLKTW